MAKSAAREPHVLSAITELREFMHVNLAASKIELEAKLIDSHLGRPPFEPAHLHDARMHLMNRGEIIIDRTRTRGGGSPPILVTTDRNNRARRVDDTTARKRLLMSRYYSYVQGSEGGGASLAGPAGELAFQAALTRASVGASIATFTRGMPSVPRLFATDVPTGPLDNGFILQPLDPVTLAPVEPYGVYALVEVKNIREWVYPRTQELYQVLMKASEIQHAHPEANILPILVCRKAHVTTKFMAKKLGFFVIEAERQYLPESSLIDPDAFVEMTSELGIADLVQGTTSTNKTENRLHTIQRYFDVKTSIDTWKARSSELDFRQYLNTLFDDELPNKDRDNTLHKLRELVMNGQEGAGW